MTRPENWVQQRLNRSPVRKTRRSLRTSRVELARQLRLNDSVLYLAELGCYSNLPIRLLEFFREKEVVIRTLLPAYSQFRKDEREIAGNHFNLLDFNPEHADLDPIAALSLYIGGSRADLSKVLCLSPAVLYKVERHIPQTLPLDFRVALRQCGMTTEQIDKIEKNYAY